MKKIFILLLVGLLLPSVYGQSIQQVKVINNSGAAVDIPLTLSATGRNNINTGAYSTGAAKNLDYVMLSWTVHGGTFTTCSIKLEKSSDNTNWSDLITSQDCASDGQTTIWVADTTYVAVNLETYTAATGTPVLHVSYLGFYSNPMQSTSATISTAGLATSTKQSDGSQKTQVVDGSGNVIGATSNALDVNIKSGTVAVTGVATEASLAKLTVAPTTAIGSNTGTMVQGAVTTGAPTYTTGTINPLSLTTAGAARVNVDNISADIADGSDVTGRAPATIGTQGGTVERAVVDAGDSVRVMSTLTGLPVVWMTALPGDTWEYYANVTDASEDTVKALETNYYMCITELFVQNASTTVATKFSIKDDTSGATLIAGYADTNGGGFSRGNGSAPVVCNTTVSKGFYSVAGTTGADLLVHVRGFRTKVKPTL